MPPLGLYAEPDDLEERLAAIERETAAAGLELDQEVTTSSESGTRYVVRSYRGRDRLGSPTRATRVASPHGVVLAVGPEHERQDDAPTELVRFFELGEGRVLALPGPLVEGGEPEIVLRARSGALGVYTLGPRGAAQIPVGLPAPPTRVRELASGRLALAVDLRVPPDREPPLLAEVVATEVGSRFDVRGPEVGAFHGRERDRLSEPVAEESDAARLDRITLRAFHAIRAGEDAKITAEAVGAVPMPTDLRDTRQVRAAWLRAQR